jgi:hypothetical protein
MDRMSECRKAQGSARVTVPVKELKTQGGAPVGRVKEQSDVPVKLLQNQVSAFVGRVKHSVPVIQSAWIL